MERGRIGPTDYEWTRGKENVFKIRKRFEEGLKEKKRDEREGEEMIKKENGRMGRRRDEWEG